MRRTSLSNRKRSSFGNKQSGGRMYGFPRMAANRTGSYVRGRKHRISKRTVSKGKGKQAGGRIYGFPGIAAIRTGSDARRRFKRRPQSGRKSKAKRGV